MSALWIRIKAELELIRARWDQRLNVLASLLVGYLVANATQFQSAVTSLVPAQYQAVAGMACGIFSYALVRLASSSSRKVGQ